MRIAHACLLVGLRRVGKSIVVPLMESTTDGYDAVSMSKTRPVGIRKEHREL